MVLKLWQTAVTAFAEACVCPSDTSIGQLQSVRFAAAKHICLSLCPYVPSVPDALHVPNGHKVKNCILM